MEAKEKTISLSYNKLNLCSAAQHFPHPKYIFIGSVINDISNIDDNTRAAEHIFIWGGKDKKRAL